jgi:tetratricopeptide (TPR) repeat protein
VDAVLPDAPGLPAEALAAMQRERAPVVARVSDEIAWIARTPLRAVVRDYLALALDCSYPSRPRSPGQPGDPPRKRPVLAPGAPPIIAYRTGICVEVDTTMLARARRAVPAFDEAAYFHGIVAALAADETGGGDAAELFAQAYRRFPRSPGVTFMSGWLASVVGDCATAVRYFDATLSIQPAHDNAMLRRTICLSKLHRDSAAIVSATQLIALETESLEQGYYWRALSRHRLKELSLARSDIGFAKARMRVASFLTLAGIIEHDQGDLAVAEQDLREARTLFRGEENCAAAWYLALVLNKSKRPGESAQTFEAAMACYEVNVSAIRGKIVRLQEKAAVNPAHTAKRIAALEADSTEQRTRYYSAAFNAAGNQANAGNVARAIQLLEIAASDPKLTDAVSKLRAAIVNLR